MKTLLQLLFPADSSIIALVYFCLAVLKSVKLSECELFALCPLRTQPCSLMKFKVKEGLNELVPLTYFFTVIITFHFYKRTLQILSA